MGKYKGKIRAKMSKIGSFLHFLEKTLEVTNVLKCTLIKHGDKSSNPKLTYPSERWKNC